MSVAASLEIDIEHEIDLKNGYYITKEIGSQGRYALITHNHGRFEGAGVMLAECNAGYVVSELPPKLSTIRMFLKPNDYILTQCTEA